MQKPYVLILTLLLFCLSPSAFAEDEPLPYSPHIDFSGRIGNERNIGSINFWIPVTGGKDHLLFTDLRFQRDNLDGSEINAGLGYRWVEDQTIYGLYGFFDRRHSQFNNYFSQITAGGEMLTHDWDFRVNTYWPVSDEKNVPEETVPAEAFVAGNSLFVTEANIPEETPLFGLDLELGHTIPYTEGKARAFVGGFHFTDDEGDADNVTGGRVRAYYDVNDWLRVGGEVQYDNVRDRTAFADIRVRIPLQVFSETKKPKLTGIHKRMSEGIVRDIDIVTQNVLPPTPARKPVNNAASGTAQEIWFVDNTAGGGGAGTSEDPFNTLAAAEAAAGANDIIYVREGDGLTTGMAAGITLNDTGQMLIGSGADFNFDSSIFNVGASIADGTTIIAATNNPVITGGGDGIAITADDVLVQGLTVNAAGADGIELTDADDVTVRNTTITASATRGFEAVYTTAGQTYDLSFLNNTVTGTVGNHNVHVQDTGSNTVNATLTGNTSTGTVAQNGMSIASTGAGLMNVTASNNTVSNNGNAGLNINASGTGRIVALVENNIIQGNGSRGSHFNMTAAGGVTHTVTYRNNLWSGNGAEGVRVRVGNVNNSVEAIFEVNTSTGNAGNGIWLMDTNGAGGPLTADLGGGALSSAGGNRIFGNTGTEIQMDTEGVAIGAQNNWWGVATGLNTGTEVTVTSGVIGDLDASNFLTADPNP